MVDVDVAVVAAEVGVAGAGREVVAVRLNGAAGATGAAMTTAASAALPLISTRLHSRQILTVL